MKIFSHTANASLPQCHEANGGGIFVATCQADRTAQPQSKDRASSGNTTAIAALSHSMRQRRLRIFWQQRIVRFICCFMFLMCCVCAATAIARSTAAVNVHNTAMPDIPAQVQLINGSWLTADVLGIDGDTLHLRLREGTTRIGETALPLERIARIAYDDNTLWQQAASLEAQGRVNEANTLRTQLYFKHEGALRFADIETIRRFADLARTTLERGDALLATRIARNCTIALGAATPSQIPQGTVAPTQHTDALPQNTVTPQQGAGTLPQSTVTSQQGADASPQAAATQPQSANAPASGIGSHNPPARKPRPTQSLAKLLTDLADTELLALWRLDLPQQAIAQATARTTTADITATSALPYAILAAHAFDSGDTEAALELALYPIVFQSRFTPEQMSYIGTAYALAITSAAARNAHSHAEMLDAQAQREGVHIDNALAARRTSGSTSANQGE